MCMKCHDPENDPKFDLNKYMPKIWHSGMKAGGRRRRGNSETRFWLRSRVSDSVHRNWWAGELVGRSPSA